MMDTRVTGSALLDTLDSQSDDELRDLIGRAKDLLATRVADRQKQAVLEIRRIAKENGLTAQVSKHARKRGRPPRT